MRVAVTGGTGFIGQALIESLIARGDKVVIVTRSIPESSRRRPGVDYVLWQDAASPEAIGRVDAIVNLAGESVNQRWTAASKKRILESRLRAAADTAALAAAQPVKPRVAVNASGISVYGSSDTAIFDESGPPGHDFLSQVVVQWEAAADRIPAERIVKLRIGLVVNAKGGAFPLMALPYRMFFGGRVGSGRQWLSWIHLEDMVRLILFCLDNDGMSGTVNACAPNAAANDRFGRAIARAFRKPHWFPVPAFLLKAAFGEMSSLLLEGQHAVPKRALEAGFRFNYASVDEALAAVASNKGK